MARIRTIKPEICTSSQFVECSTNARLLFVLMLCFFDDGGNHPANIKRIKMEIFPADGFQLNEIEAMMGELIKQGLVVVYSVNNELFWHVTGFNKHQKIDRPNPKFPKFDECSTINQGTFDVQSPPEGKGRDIEEHCSSDYELGTFRTYKKKLVDGKRLESFLMFWDAFQYKAGKAKAGDAWLDIPSLTEADVDKIVTAARTEAQRRPQLIAKGTTPKMAQGWLSERRWEDEPSETAAPQQRYN